MVVQGARGQRPMQNDFIESFNGPLRQEFLNEHYFTNLENARDKIKAWRCFYNEARPHSALD